MTDTVGQAAAALGRVSVLCNVAGIGAFSHTADMPLDLWQKILAVNLTGTFLMAKAVLPPMLEAKDGSIVNVASNAGLMGSPWSAAYCASKGGVVLFTKALAVEYAGRGVRVNAVAPGGVDTPLVSNFSVPEGGDRQDAPPHHESHGLLDTGTDRRRHRLHRLRRVRLHHRRRPLGRWWPHRLDPRSS